MPDRSNKPFRKQRKLQFPKTNIFNNSIHGSNRQHLSLQSTKTTVCPRIQVFSSPYPSCKKCQFRPSVHLLKEEAMSSRLIKLMLLIAALDLCAAKNGSKNESQGNGTDEEDEIAQPPAGTTRYRTRITTEFSAESLICRLGCRVLWRYGRSRTFSRLRLHTTCSLQMLLWTRG